MNINIISMAFVGIAILHLILQNAWCIAAVAVSEIVFICCEIID